MTGQARNERYFLEGNAYMDGKLRNMTSIYIFRGNKFLLLFRQGGKVVNDVWVASAGGHFEKEELNDAKVCVLRELREELNITENMLGKIQLRYVTLKRHMAAFITE